MKKPILYIIMLLLSIALIPVQAGDKQSAEKALSEARNLLEKSVAVEGGWQSTKKLIGKAELSVTKGNYDQARKLADQAIREARLSLEQANRENKNWSEPSYLSK